MPDSGEPHRRRRRYAGRYPRRFEDKYKERQPALYPETVAKVIASGKTPAGTHRPVLLAEVLEALRPEPGQIGADCTTGYGGHALELLQRLRPGGRMLCLDADPIELPKTEERIRALGFGADECTFHRSNFAGLRQILAASGISGVHFLLADLGVSSMQLDDPTRGFSMKGDGPLDMRMNPRRGRPASALIAHSTANELESLFAANADEPQAAILAQALAGRTLPRTRDLVEAIHDALGRRNREDRELSVRRVFQALRIEVNDEFSALEAFLRDLPFCLSEQGRAAIITFHSGEDRRVKKAFEAGLRDGSYAEIAQEVIRPSPEERRANSRSIPAKLRWAIRGSRSGQAERFT